MRQQFIDDVKGGDLISVRLTLTNELMLDPRGGSFEEMLRFAETNMSDLYENDNNKSFSSNEADWNKELLYDLKNELDYNFSRNKLDLYRKIIKVVLREKAQSMEAEQRESNSHNNTTERDDATQQDKPNTDGKKLIYGGVAVAIVGLIVPHAIAKVAMVAAGVAAIAAGKKLSSK